MTAPIDGLPGARSWQRAAEGPRASCVTSGPGAGPRERTPDGAERLACFRFGRDGGEPVWPSVPPGRRAPRLRVGRRRACPGARNGFEVVLRGRRAARLHGCAALTDDAVRLLAEGAPQLERVDLRGRARPRRQLRCRSQGRVGGRHKVSQSEGM